MVKLSRVPLEQEPISGVATVENYDRYASLFMRPEYRLTVNKLIKKGAPNGSVLDIGTGSGQLVLDLLRVSGNRYNIVGLDVSLDMLEKARQNLAFSGILGRVDWIMAGGSGLPFSDNSFDIVTSYASLHHWKEPVKVFNEMWRVARPGALILVRDNRRMLGSPFFRAGVWLISRFMRKQQRSSWPKSIMASYTVSEVREILKKTVFKNSRVYADMLGFDLCIEAVKER